MSDKNPDKTGLSRRSFLGTAAITGAAGLVGGAQLSTAHGKDAKAGAAGQSGHVAPGELDEYYAFNSSGQSGEVRVLGLPSMRELVRIPVFNHCSATGWGRTNESRKILTEGLTPETREYLKDKGGVFLNGDAHHPHLSFTDAGQSGIYTSMLGASDAFLTNPAGGFSSLPPVDGGLAYRINATANEVINDGGNGGHGGDTSAVPTPAAAPAAAGLLSVLGLRRRRGLQA